MPQTVLSLSFQYALLLHISTFYTAPLPSVQVFVPPRTSRVAACVCSFLRVKFCSEGCGKSGSSIIGILLLCCSFTATCLLVRHAWDFERDFFVVVPLAVRKSRIILWLNKNTVNISLWVCLAKQLVVGHWKATRGGRWGNDNMNRILQFSGGQRKFEGKKHICGEVVQ